MILRLFWWQYKNNNFENYGDLISLFLVKKISKKLIINSNHKFNWFITKFFKKYYLSIGSIISYSSKNAIVWGSGIMKEDEKVKNATFLAVRGPRTRDCLIKLGYFVPEIYGDPAILLPNYHKNINIEKKFEIGVIPHYLDYENVHSSLKKDKRIKVINILTKSIEATTNEILECNFIVSSSLHGLIVGQAYRIPSLWIKFSEKLPGDNIKFYDYYESMNIEFKTELFIDANCLNFNFLFELLEKNKDVLLQDNYILEKRKVELMKVCPF